MALQQQQIDWSRILVVGTSCAGKTTLARRLAARLDLPHVELDALHWLPNWQERPDEEFRDLILSHTVGPRWVVDGNYRRVAQPLLWPRASVILWLDYSFTLVLWRGLQRTIRRAVGGEVLFAGNRESLAQAFLSLDSILWWIVKTHHRRRRDYGALRANGHHPMLALGRPADAERLLATLPPPA